MKVAHNSFCYRDLTAPAAEGTKAAGYCLVSGSGHFLSLSRISLLSTTSTVQGLANLSCVGHDSQYYQLCVATTQLCCCSKSSH